MPTYIHNYALALGWNMPEGSLNNLEALSVSGAVTTLADVFARHEVDNNTHFLATGRTITERNMVMTGNATIVQNGRERKDLNFMWVSDKALNYWIDTYEGEKVTFKTSVRQFNQYTRYNVTVGQTTYQAPEYLQGTWWYSDVIIPLYIQGTAT